MRRARAFLFLPVLVFLCAQPVVAESFPVGESPIPEGVSWLRPESERAIAISHWEFTPRVVNVDVVAGVELEVQTDGSPDSVSLDLAAGGTLALTGSGGGRYSVVLSHAQILADYGPDDVYRNFVGFLEGYSGATLLFRVNLFIGVVDASIPQVPVFDLDWDVRASSRVANIWMPGLDVASISVSTVANRFFDFFLDGFDFLAVVSIPSVAANRYYSGVKNEVLGIGLTVYDSSSTYGSGGTLQGYIRYPNTTFFDLADTMNLHEIGHRWANFLAAPELQGIVPHWPISSLAQGIMGWQVAANPQGLQFPYELVPVGGGDYELVYVGPFLEFSRMELYLMGMIQPSEVSDGFVFEDQTQTVCGGCILNGPTVAVGIPEVVAAHGPRIPAFPAAQTSFSIATIIVSESGLLTADEMAFYDFFASRGEAVVELPFHSGFATGITWPFALATGGRGALNVNIWGEIFSDGFESGDTGAW